VQEEKYRGAGRSSIFFLLSIFHCKLYKAQLLYGLLIYLSMQITGSCYSHSPSYYSCTPVNLEQKKQLDKEL